MYKLNLQYWNKEKLASIVFVIVGLLMGRVVLFGGINGCAIGYLTCFLFNKNIFYAVAVTIFTGLDSKKNNGYRGICNSYSFNVSV